MKKSDFFVVGIISVLFTTLVSCESVHRLARNSHFNLINVLSELPDSLRNPPFIKTQGKELTSSEMDTLIKNGIVTSSRGNSWKRYYKDSLRTHLQLKRITGPDEGLKYDFLSLSPKGNPHWVLIIQHVEDHCCSFARWVLLKARKDGWVERTDLMPRINWNNFFSPNHLPDPAPEGPEIDNYYPFIMEIKLSPPRIEVSLVADYFDLGYSEEPWRMLADHIPDQPKVLIWKNERFVWEEK